MHYPISAVVTLFTNILQNPQHPRARTDLQLMAPVVEFLRGVLEQDLVDGFEGSPTSRVMGLCGAFQRAAGVALDKAEKEGPNRRKRKPDNASSGVPVERQQQQQQQRRPAELPGAASTMGLNGGAVDGMPANMDTNSQVCMLLGIAVLCVPALTNRHRHHQFYGGGGGDMNQVFSSSHPLSWPSNLEPGPGTPTPLDPDIVSLAGTSFELPFVSHDPWQAPVTFEWDWPELNGQLLWDAGNPIFRGLV